MKRANDPTKPWREKLELDGVIGRSPALARLFQQISNFARTDIGLLITGASGTGKTSIAAAIHRNSPRREKRFSALNCGELQPELARSELFGHKKGSFSHAVADKAGHVEVTDGGTLFLDDVDLLPMEVQALLLQFLQNRTYTRVGDTTVKRAEVRVLFATNKRLEQEMEAGRFRKDLYYRIAEASVRMPSISERRDDIPLLAAHFLAEVVEETRTAPIPISPVAISILETADLRGEVRELRSLVRSAYHRARGEDAAQIEVRHLFENQGASEPEDPASMTYHEATRWFQGRFLKQTLDAVNGDIDAAIKRLELGRSRLYDLIRIHGIELGKK